MIDKYTTPKMSAINIVADTRFLAGSGALYGMGMTISYDDIDQEWD